MKPVSRPPAIRKGASAPKGSAKSRGVSAAARPRKRTKKSAIDVAIATDLAPGVAIALLEKTEQAPGSPAPALDCLAAGVAPSETQGKVRVQLMFDSGAVLPVEMSVAAGAALSDGLSDELPRKK